MTNANDDPVYGAMEAHRHAYAAFDKAVSDADANAADGLAEEQRAAAFSALDKSCRRLVAGEFKTISGLIALLEYMAPLLREPGTPAMPLEIIVDDQQWETVFGLFCENMAKALEIIVSGGARS